MLNAQCSMRHRYRRLRVRRSDEIRPVPIPPEADIRSDVGAGPKRRRSSPPESGSPAQKWGMGGQTLVFPLTSHPSSYLEETHLPIMALRAGDKLGAYEITGPIGKGG